MKNKRLEAFGVIVAALTWWHQVAEGESVTTNEALLDALDAVADLLADHAKVRDRREREELDTEGDGEFRQLEREKWSDDER
jgi:hypothetical protein